MIIVGSSLLTEMIINHSVEIAEAAYKGFKMLLYLGVIT